VKKYLVSSSFKWIDVSVSGGGVQKSDASSFGASGLGIMEHEVVRDR
jgi:hypothetical protein